MKCTEFVKSSGAPCIKNAVYGSLCLFHAGSHGNHEAVAELSRRGRRSRELASQRRAAEHRRAVKLRSATDCLQELEYALSRLERSNADACAKSSTACKIISTAHDVLRGQLEKSAEEISELLTRYPHLAQRLEQNGAAQ
jgi:hypothetical protein